MYLTCGWAPFTLGYQRERKGCEVSDDNKTETTIDLRNSILTPISDIDEVNNSR